MDAPVPIFDLSDTFDTTIVLGDRPLPIHVKRFSRAEMEAFEKKWQTHVVASRGSDAIDLARKLLAQAPPDGVLVLATTTVEAILARVDVARVDASDPQQAKDDLLRFCEDTIRDAVTVDEGYLKDRGRWVTTGADLIGMFHARGDVLGALMHEVYASNKLTTLLRKNLNSPRGSEPGLPASIPARGGDRPGSTAGSAASSATAPDAGATDASSTPPADAPASSGASQDEAATVGKVH